MRELVFTLEYAPGCNAVADTLTAHPDARIRSLSLHATPESLWRVDHASGTAAALTAIEDAFLTSDYYADCLAAEDCGATQHTQVLEHSDDTLVLYSYWDRTPSCVSVPHIALSHLGDGVLFETRHNGRIYTWRVIHSSHGNVRAFTAEVEATVGECAEMDIKRVTDAAAPTDAVEHTANELSPEQRAALEAAVEHGYYETPREVTVDDLATRLEIPRSTLTYRLRRAEAYLAESYASENGFLREHRRGTDPSVDQLR